jgi:predicted transposase/invertase (TIGR01784 family)
MRYLDPRADLTFKRIFGEHEDLVISLLNALLPLDDDHLVKTVEYIPVELVPDNPLKKNSIVDVRCFDQEGRQFLVEMQMIWSQEFMQRVLFNASKAYVRQLDKKQDYKLLQPVYSLNLVNDIFMHDIPDYYHHYDIVNVEHTDKRIDGLHLVFVELPKFEPHTFSERKMQVLWLRFLTEMGDVRKVPQEFLDNPEVKKAVDILEESSYTDAQLNGYDKFWDIVRTERTYINSALRKGMAQGRAKGFEQGMAQGMAQGIEEGRAQGEKSALYKVVEKMRKMGMTDAQIVEATGLTLQQVEQCQK